ncbi:MAG: hypothetical protein IH886_14010 [Nitrospinae bacterium]|nr:hypothetical protein [Nitrospinota bacterium]
MFYKKITVLGKYIQHYEMTLCNSCFKRNWDGFTPGLEAQFIAHMKSKGIALPERNDEGWCHVE